MKEIIIDGNNFSDLEGFYDEIDKALTRNLDWKTGHNLNALNDILWGGFGVHEYQEPIKTIWWNHAKSKCDFSYDRNLFDTIVEMIRKHNHLLELA